MRKLCYVCLVAVAALVVAGCGGKVIDADNLEQEIDKKLEEAGLVVDEVSCPEVDAKAGETFNCTVTVKGEEKELEVEQTDDDGNVTFNPASLVEETAGGGSGEDEASVATTLETVNAEPAGLCDFASEAYKADCANVNADDVAPVSDYEIVIEGDSATATGTGPSGEVVFTLERADDGTWVIAAVE